MINELIQRLQIYQEEDRNKDVLRNNTLGQIEDGWKNLKNLYNDSGAGEFTLRILINVPSFVDKK